MEPSKQALDFPATSVAAQHPAVLCCFSVSRGAVRRNQLDTKTLANLGVQRIAVVSAIADQTLGSFGKEAPLDGGFNESCFMQ